MKSSLFEKYKTSEVTNTRRVICTPGQFTRDHFFYIQEAGYLKSLQPHLSKRSGLKSYLFMIVLSGSGTVSYKDASPAKTTAVSAMAGDCFFLDCSKEYTHGNCSGSIFMVPRPRATIPISVNIMTGISAPGI